MSQLSLARKAELLSTLGAWPSRHRLEPSRWLGNFDPDDIEAAEVLGQSFLYIPEVHFVATLRAALLSMCELLPQLALENYPCCGTWPSFIGSSTFCIIDDARRHLTESGFFVARHLRESLGVPEARIKPLREFAEFAEAASPVTPVVFVDDFLGTGRQLTDAFSRRLPLRDNRVITLEELRSRCAGAWVSVSAFANLQGLMNAQRALPYLSFSYGAALDERYSWNTDWLAGDDPILANDVRSIIQSYASRYGHASNALGYEQQALAIAFSHGIPDATLPLFTAESDDWRPLLRRSQL